MTLASSLGLGKVSWLQNINIYSVMHGVSNFIGLLILFAITGGILYLAYYLKNKKKEFNKKIVWFENIHGETVFVSQDMAKELIIPGTKIKVLLIKRGRQDIYLPAPTIKMSPNEYWYIIDETQEARNFKLKSVVDGKASIKFDHNDQRYASANLTKLIDRNFRSKSKVWWREYKDVIAVTILIFMLTLSFLFLIGKVGGLIDKVGDLIKIASSNAHCASAVSGIAAK